MDNQMKLWSGFLMKTRIYNFIHFNSLMAYRKSHFLFVDWFYDYAILSAAFNLISTCLLCPVSSHFHFISEHFPDGIKKYSSLNL